MDAVENSTMEAQHIPVDMAAGPGASVPEPVDLGELEVFVTELDDEYASAGGTEIDRDDTYRPQGRRDCWAND
jgi:hypothetical protein